MNIVCFHPEAAGVIFEYNVFAGLTHGLQLPALFPGVQPFPVAGGVADLIVSDVAAVELRQLMGITLMASSRIEFR